MFKSIARLGVAFIAAMTISVPAPASTYSVDYSDLWGGGQPNPTEQGWGLNLIQQGDVIFATMFVYGADNSARWFSATLTGGPGTWSGALDQSTGSFYSAPWNNAAVTHNPVGTMTLNFNSSSAGSLSYSVSGVTVNKLISRFSLRMANLGGRYLGGAVATCPGTSSGVLIYDMMTVSQSGANVTMQVDFFNSNGVQSRCTYTGALNTTGRLGSITGNYSCTAGTQSSNVGTFTITNLETSTNGFNGDYVGRDQFCPGQNQVGRFGGLKDPCPGGVCQ
jgi:hypothetical protein